MTERKLEAACMKAIQERLPRCYLWKIHDEVTAGQPDLEANWNGATTKIEFKLLKKNETVHDKWEDRRQLITCLRYEQQTTRCWVVAYRKGYLERPDETLIYRPSRLLDGQVPEPSAYFISVGFGNLSLLWSEGVIALRGFNHGGVAALLELTHS